MILRKIILLGILLMGTSVYSQEIKKDVVEKKGVKNNISTATVGMYNGTSSEKAHDFFEKAHEYSEKQDFKNAEIYYLKALREDPRFIEAYDNLGRIYRRVGQYNKAIDYYKKSIKLYPQGIVAHQNIALVYSIKKDYGKAIQEYEEMVKISPGNPEGYFGLANAYLMTSQYAPAAKNALKAITIYKQMNSPYLGEGYYLTGLIYYYSGNAGEAKKYLLLAKEKGAKINPEIDKALFSSPSAESNIRLKTKEDYAKYEPKVLEDINWLLNTPLNREVQKRKEINTFLMQWLTGSPSVSIELSEKVVTYTDCPDCLMIFLCGWTKYALSTSHYNKLDANLAGTESVIDFYAKNKNTTGKNKSIEKLIKLRKKGKLKDYIRASI